MERFFRPPKSLPPQGFLKNPGRRKKIVLDFLPLGHYYIREIHQWPPGLEGASLMSDYGEIVCGHTVVADGGDNYATL